MKEHSRDQKFADGNEVMEAVQSWFKTMPKSFFFFLEGNCKLVDMWTNVLRNRGTMSKNKAQTISINTLLKKVIIKFLLFNDLPS